MAKSTGCALSGFVLVKKVPGTLHFLPKSPGHSFDYHSINMSHTVGYMYYGNKPSPRRRKVFRQFSRQLLKQLAMSLILTSSVDIANQPMAQNPCSKPDCYSPVAAEQVVAQSQYQCTAYLDLNSQCLLFKLKWTLRIPTLFTCACHITIAQLMCEPKACVCNR